MKSSQASEVINGLSNDIISWYSDNYRELPWRSTRDPYIIWLSEIILQQTRISQGLPYFEKFCEYFPTVHSLARASEDEVLKLWQGLGYYSRARNLHFTAKFVSNNLKGVFPSSYHELLKLKGVGKYTAAAIASICYNEKVPAIDGNAFRVFSRIFGISENIAEGKSFKTFFDVAKEVLPKNKPGFFNQAIMDLGATICTPGNPSCENCPVRNHCFAYRKGSVKNFPVKKKKVTVRSRRLTYYIITNQNKVLIKQRSSKGIWQGLYEFLLVEKNQSIRSNFRKELSGKPLFKSEKIDHRLTHQKLSIWFRIYSVNDDEFERIKKKYQMESILVSKIDNFAVPKPIEHFLKSNHLLLNSNLN